MLGAIRLHVVSCRAGFEDQVYSQKPQHPYFKGGCPMWQNSSGLNTNNRFNQLESEWGYGSSREKKKSISKWQTITQWCKCKGTIRTSITHMESSLTPRERTAVSAWKEVQIWVCWEKHFSSPPLTSSSRPYSVCTKMRGGNGKDGRWAFFFSFRWRQILIRRRSITATSGLPSPQCPGFIVRPVRTIRKAQAACSKYATLPN